MRFRRIELSPNNKKQYNFAVGLRDLELLHEEALNAHRYMPNTPETKDDKRRLSKISRAFREALEEARKDGDDGKSVPMADRPAYKIAKDLNPLLDITRMEVIDHRPCKACEGKGIIVAENYVLSGERCALCGGAGMKGRYVVFFDKDTEVTSSIQDEGKTMKLFLDDRKDYKAMAKVKQIIDDISGSQLAGLDEFTQFLERYWPKK